MANMNGIADVSSDRVDSEEELANGINSINSIIGANESTTHPISRDVSSDERRRSRLSNGRLCAHVNGSDRGSDDAMFRYESDAIGGVSSSPDSSCYVFWDEAPVPLEDDIIVRLCDNENATFDNFSLTLAEWDRQRERVRESLEDLDTPLPPNERLPGTLFFAEVDDEIHRAEIISRTDGESVVLLVDYEKIIPWHCIEHFLKVTSEAPKWVLRKHRLAFRAFVRDVDKSIGEEHLKHAFEELKDLSDTDSLINVVASKRPDAHNDRRYPVQVLISLGKALIDCGVADPIVETD